MGYNYNGKLRSAEVLLCEDGSHRLIRRAETPRDYFATLDFLPYMKPLTETCAAGGCEQRGGVCFVVFSLPAA